MDFDLRKSGQIPAFGNWDSSNDMPITQYFESARQAGLVRYSASSGVDCNKCPNNNNLNNNRNYGHVVHYGGGDLYAAVMPPSRGFYVPAPPHPKVRAMNRRHQEVERKRIVMKVRDVMDIENQYKNQQLKPKQAKSRQQFPFDKNSQNLAEHVEELRPATIIVKPVDEDLYKIPPELIHKSERLRTTVPLLGPKYNLMPLSRTILAIRSSTVLTTSCIHSKRRLGFLSRCFVPPCSA